MVVLRQLGNPAYLTQVDSLASPTENSDLILFVDGSYLKTKTGSYQAANAIPDSSSPLKCNLLPEVKSV